ncbi:unnamed protein product, partial [Musa textilis]
IPRGCLLHRYLVPDRPADLLLSITSSLGGKYSACISVTYFIQENSININNM